MLYLDYRPGEWGEVLGNKETVAALQTIKDKPKPPKAILFIGPSGCGKTTLARLLAADVGIHDMDLVELDSADFRGIDTIRGIRESMAFAPSKGSYRGWILDEVHQLTKDAQNALLKALEDTPKHVYFFLCTTDPQKLLPTIRTRCTDYVVEQLSEELLVQLMEEILEAEGKAVPSEVLGQIARDATGSPRLALVILEKVVDLPEKDMLAAAERQAEVENEVVELCRLLVAGKKAKWKDIINVLKGLKGQDPESIRYAVLGYLNAVALNRGSEREVFVMDCFREPYFNTKAAGLTMSCLEAYKLG